jgi:hypothetical protein
LTTREMLNNRVRKGMEHGFSTQYAI